MPSTFKPLRFWLGLLAGIALTLVVLVSFSLHARSLYKGPLFHSRPTNAKPVATVQVYDFSSLVSRVKPSVFNITVRGKEVRRSSGRHFWDDDFFGFPFGFRRVEPRAVPVMSSGSGFLINAAGYALTNHHVVKHGDDIRAQLHDGREFKVKVIGRSSLIDLALIRLEAPKGTKFPFAFLGSSEVLKVGEPVVAIGNARGLGLTVTAGIVSAKGRVIGSGSYDDYIQTDAAINRGNSGGPLFNRKGEVVGINTAILRRGRGIGFAIPTDLVRQVLPQLRDKGKIERSQLGVKVQKMTPAIATSLGLPQQRGALIAEVTAGSAAAKASLKAGDVVLKVNGRKVRNYRHLPLLIAFQQPDQTITLQIWRERKEQTLKVRLQKWSKDGRATSSSSLSGDHRTSLSRLGVRVSRLSRDKRKSLRLKEGVEILSVDSDSVAEENGLRAGDVIVEVNRERVRSPKDFKRLLSNIKKGQTALFLVRREQSSLFLAFPLP